MVLPEGVEPGGHLYLYKVIRVGDRLTLHTRKSRCLCLHSYFGQSMELDIVLASVDCTYLRLIDFAVFLLNQSLLLQFFDLVNFILL